MGGDRLASFSFFCSSWLCCIFATEFISFWYMIAVSFWNSSCSTISPRLVA
jgi:hypothetical protein